MNLIDQSEPAPVQIARQARIIDALVRRATRQNDVGQTAFSAFQAAIELQARVLAKTRDLERAATELESVRHERERTRKNLDQTLSAMGEGFALFAEGRLVLCNELFQNLLPDVADRIRPGLRLPEYLDLLAQCKQVVSTDRRLDRQAPRQASLSLVIELIGDRWYQLSVKATSPDTKVMLLTDITAVQRRSRSEKAHLIDRQADDLQAVFENLSSGVCRFSAQGEVTTFNQQFRQLLDLPFTTLRKGMVLAELLGLLAARGRIDGAALERIEAWWAKLARRGAFRQRLRNRDEQVFELQANMLPDGGFVVELKDMTLESRATETLEQRVRERTQELTLANERLLQQFEDKARVEEELRLAKERAEAAVKSKTRYLAAASHDLLQPVNAAKLLIATLTQTTAGTPHGATAERLKGAFASIEQMLQALLDISRLDSAERDAVTPSVLCLGKIMASVHEDQLPLAEKRGVRLRVVPTGVQVRSDPLYLLRSVQNLVVNAIQYTEPGGRVLMGCRRRGDKVVLQVWDTGIGISEADETRIFEEFTRAGNAPTGTGVGLGLSIVERTCRHLGHRLWMSTKLGAGSVFCIEFDVEARRKPRTAPGPAAGRSHFLAPGSLGGAGHGRSGARPLRPSRKPASCRS